MVVYSKFSGYKWSGLLTFPKGSTCYNQAVLLLERVNWTALCCAASSARDGRSCIVKPEIAMGQRHMVRIIEFEDGIRWIARLPIPASAPEPDDYAAATLRKEAACLGLVKEQSKIPVPAVFACITSGHGEIGAPVLLMECLQGNVGMDLNFDFIPAEFKSSFLGEMARIQAEISRITFPRIGQVTRLCDGTYDVGPLEGLGGPFDTAAEYFEAWARHVEFPMGDDKIRACSGPAADEILQSIAEFPARIGKLASRLCARDAGPFPLIHPDFGHNNIIVDDEYNVLGVIDWEGAQTVPWAAINFPLTLSAVPKAADAPWCYDADGQPKDPKSRERAADRVRYVAAVREAERKAGSPTPLADCLGDPKVQDVAAAMHLFNDGKVGFFTKVLDQHYPDSSAKSLPP